MRIPTLIKDCYVLGYLSLYLLTMIILGLFTDYEPSEAISVGLIFGVALPLVAYWSTKKSSPIVPAKESSPRQFTALFGSLALVTIFLAIGPADTASLIGFGEDQPRFHEVTVLVLKLLFFVIVPALIFIRACKFGWKDFGFDFNLSNWRRHKQLRVALIVIPLMLLFQLFVGRGGVPLRTETFTATQYLFGFLFGFIWLIFEVGLVEEFFFRSIVQSRIAACFNSETAGVLIGGLIFGLAHAPGLYLRGAGSITPIGTEPSLLLAIGYSIVVLSAAGIFMGVLWSRTRNLVLLVSIHAFIDLIPSFADFVKTWNIS